MKMSSEVDTASPPAISLDGRAGMHFENATDQRAEVALELLMEGRHVNYRGLGLQLAGSELQCRLFVACHPEAVGASIAASAFAAGKAALDGPLLHTRFASALAGRLQRWELLCEYGGEALRLCRLDPTGKLVWDSGWHALQLSIAMRAVRRGLSRDLTRCGSRLHSLQWWVA